jgi:hypothetical protein
MRTLMYVLLAVASVCTLFAASAQAQRDRVFVASYGSDSNPCTFGSPCKTFQNAVDVVAAGGEVTAIDSAGFGPVVISHAVTITSPNGVEAGIAAAATGTAVTIQAGSGDTVVLSGLTLEGAGTAAQGVAFESGAKLEINNCIVRNFTNDGVLIDASAAMSILISNTIISDNGNYGIGLYSLSSGSIIAAFDRVTVNNNGWGIVTTALGNSIEATIAESHIDNNKEIGIDISGSTSSATSNFILKDVTMNQTPTGIFLAQNSSVWLSGVMQGTANGTIGINFFSGGAGNNTAYSDGTNHITGSILGGNLTLWTTQ